ncbi:MAG: hypothetical protein WD794_08705 [Mycobacteriales bacterium]
MKRRRFSLALLALGVAAASAAFVFPVTADGYGSCGPAGSWFPYLGDPSGPTDLPEIYAEHVACGQAAAVPHLVLVISLLVVVVCLAALLVQRSRLP